MVQSCHSSLLNPDDFKDRQKNTYPIVICYNGRDHFTPTKSTTLKNYTDWKLNRELGPIIAAGLTVITELDLQHLPPDVVNHINELEASIVAHLPGISPSANAAHLRLFAERRKQTSVNTGPVFSKESGSSASGVPGQPQSLPSSTSAQASSSQAHPPDEEQQEEDDA